MEAKERDCESNWRGCRVTVEEELAMAATLIRARLARGNPRGAFEIRKEANALLYRSLRGFVKSVLFSRFPTLSRDARYSEDMENQAWEAIMDALPKYDGTSALTTFAAPHAVGGASRFARHSIEWQKRACALSDLSLPSPRRSPEDAALAAELDRKVKAAVGALDPLSRAVLTKTRSGTCSLEWGRNPTLAAVCTDPEVVAIARSLSKGAAVERGAIWCSAPDKETGKVTQVLFVGEHVKESVAKAARRRALRLVRSLLKKEGLLTK